MPIFAKLNNFLVAKEGAAFRWVDFFHFLREWCAGFFPLFALTIKRGSGDTTKHLLNALTVNQNRLNADCCLHAFLQAKRTRHYGRANVG